MAPGPHPLAGQGGEGPPIAPPNWKWRAGNRVSDMYFYSPSGKQFRSRPELATYLQTLPDAPDPRLFCWKVTDEVLKNGYVPGEGSQRRASAKRKANTSIGGAHKKVKIESTEEGLSEPLIAALQMKLLPPIVPNASVTQLPPGVADFSSPMQVPPAVPPVLPPVVPPRNRQVNGVEKKKPKRVRVSSPHTFKSILAGRSSFKWLYDSETLEKFLEEASKLNQKTLSEVNDIRKVLLDRNLEMTNVCKYPNSVLRVFVRLLRNEEAPANMGKLELANLCVNWRCKKRHFWCVLEINRGSALPKSTKFEDGQRALGSGTELKANGKTKESYDSRGGNQNGSRDLHQGQQSHEVYRHHFNGSGRVVHEGCTPAEPASQCQPEGGLAQGGTSGGVLPFQKLDELTARRSDGFLTALRTEQKSVSVDPVPSFGGGSVANNPHSVVLPLGSMLHGEKVAGPQDLAQQDNAAVSWDSAGLSEAIEIFSQGKSLDSSPEASSLNFDGESIVVITNYKSGAAGGVGSVYHGDETVRFNEGSSGTLDRHDVNASDAVETTSARHDDIRSESDFSTLQDERTTVDCEFPVGSESVQRTSEEEGAKIVNFVSNSHDSMNELAIVTVPQTPGAVIPSSQVGMGQTPDGVPHPYMQEWDGSRVKKEDERTGNEFSINGRYEEKMSPSGYPGGKESSVCWCKICREDLSFCRGCMCSLCKKVLPPGEEWSVMRCICNHVCHVDCALAANAAGVVKELGLDGELSCPSCSRKVDLWSFFQKRFDLIVSLSETASVNVKELEKLLLQAVQLLKGTQKRRYKSLEGLVVESYELLRKFSFLSLVQQLLRAIRDELYLHTDSGLDFESDFESMSGESSGSAIPGGMESLKKEQLARDSLDMARKKRLRMEQVIDEVHKAYEDALRYRGQARTSSGFMFRMCESPEHGRPEVTTPVTPELIAQQQAKVDHEMRKLWDMRSFGARNFATFSSFDDSAGGWLKTLKSQRVVVDSELAELQQLEKLSSQSTAM